MILCFSGISRDSEKIIKQQRSQAENKNDSNLIEVKRLCQNLKTTLIDGDLNKFYEVMKKSWDAKKRTAGQVSNSNIDKIFDIAIKNGALSGKVSGAGGGGFIIFFTPPEKKHIIESALIDFGIKIFKFSFTNSGAGWSPTKEQSINKNKGFFMNTFPPASKINSLNYSKLVLRFPTLKKSENSIIEATNILIETFSRGSKLLTCGNGGSSADAEHICGELVKSFKKNRPIKCERLMKELPELHKKLEYGLPAFSLGVSHSFISAFINDVDESTVFAQQVLAHGKEGDTLLGITTSGNSENVINAFKVAKYLGMKTICLTGKDGGISREFSDLQIIAPALETHEVQELHLPIYHAICLEIENALF